MSISYEQVGRTHQKGRTREALLAAARRLMADGILPTVEQTAAAASVSRPTAYRYFPNRRALLKAAHPEVSAPSLLSENASADPMERLERVAAAITGMVLQNEMVLRAMWRASLEGTEDPDDLVLRTGRRIVWVGDALAPLKGRLKPKVFRALVLRVAAVLGIECFVWFTDVARMTREEAVALMRQSAMEILKASQHGRTETKQR
jgi:AcrR family transcriptional regulator